MPKKTVQRGLGRGLGALFNDAAEEALIEAERDEVMLIPVNDIDPDRNQPRRSFDEAALNELSQSIRAVGVLQPIIVKRVGERYSIIAGERRYRAARLAELDAIPAIVRDWDDDRRLEAMLVENLQRDDLNPIEEATGIKRLMEQTGMTQEKTAERLGKSRPAVANALRLLTLPAGVRDMLSDGRLSAGHGRALVSVEKARQLKLANMAFERKWSVRQLERACAMPVKREPIARVKTEGQLKQLEEMTRELFGTKAKLTGDLEKGKLTLTYYSADDLQRIWDIIAAAGEFDARI